MIKIGNHTERNVSFLGPLLETDSFRRLVGVTSFFLDLIRDGGGTVHVFRNTEIPHFSYISYSRIIYISFDFY